MFEITTSFIILLFVICICLYFIYNKINNENYKNLIILILFIMWITFITILINLMIKTNRLEYKTIAIFLILIFIYVLFNIFKCYNTNKIWVR